MDTNYSYLTSIFVSTEFVSHHFWPDAPASYHYLSTPHRHKFEVTLEISVIHDDRELEYHAVLERLHGFIDSSLRFGAANAVPLSCEVMAKLILEWAMRVWPERSSYLVEVNEDGENGSILQANQSGVASTMTS